MAVFLAMKSQPALGPSPTALGLERLVLHSPLRWDTLGTLSVVINQSGKHLIKLKTVKSL